MKRFVVLLLLISASAAYGEIYTWKDARGTVFYTNSLNEIPARYLKKARVLDVATGKKGGLATAQQPGVPGAPAASPGQAQGQQAPVQNPVAIPLPVMPQGPGPAAVNPAPVPPAAEVTAPQYQPRENRLRRAQRRREREEE
ncbi:MAG: hypothetical protein A2075_05895 [Geobacteraceae bacterium GWC2_58_44]|nr:MAG: hypothetical protein A2075_05895 [Geobacteraceae bacterium GWC2_58_44]HBG05321.1 hypothetical protein [Geobacter sp.]